MNTDVSSIPLSLRRNPELDGCQSKHGSALRSQTDVIPVNFPVGNEEIKVWFCLGLRQIRRLHADFCP